MDKRHQVQDGILKSRTNVTAREHLAAFFAQINRITPAEDENDLSEYVNNDSDGVACKLTSDIEDLQKKKLAKLAQVQSEIFPDAEEIVPCEKGAPLVNGDAGINARGRYGYTRLTEATTKNNLELVKKLVKMGASWEIPDNWGQTAWDKAFARGYDDILRVFNPNFVRKEPVQPFIDDDDET